MRGAESVVIKLSPGSILREGLFILFSFLIYLTINNHGHGKQLLNKREKEQEVSHL